MHKQIKRLSTILLSACIMISGCGLNNETNIQYYTSSVMQPEQEINTITELPKEKPDEDNQDNSNDSTQDESNHESVDGDKKTPDESDNTNHDDSNAEEKESENEGEKNESDTIPDENITEDETDGKDDGINDTADAIVDADEEAIIDEEILSMYEPVAYSLKAPNEDEIVAQVGDTKGTFREMCEYAMETGQEITMFNNAYITKQIMVDKNLKIDLRGHSIELVSGNELTMDCSVFYVDGGSLELYSSLQWSGRVMGMESMNDCAAIYIKSGSCYLDYVVVHGRYTGGKASAIYVGKDGTLTTNRVVNLVESIDADTDSGYEYVTDSEQPVVWIDGRFNVGTQPDSSSLHLMTNCYIMCGADMPDNGFDLSNSSMEYKIMVDSEVIPKEIISGSQNVLENLKLRNDRYLLTESDGSISIQMWDEASYNDNSGTLADMVKLAVADGGTQTVLVNRDLELEEQIDVTGGIDLTVNLQNHTITRVNNENMERGRIFGVFEGSSLTVTKGTLTGGRSTASGGSIFVSRWSNLTTSSITITDSKAKKGAGIYAEAEGNLSLAYHTFLIGSGDDDMVYSKRRLSISYLSSIQDGVMYLDSSEVGLSPMISYTNNEEEMPFRVMSDMPVVLSNKEQTSAFIPAYDDMAVLAYNGKTVLVHIGSEQAEFVLDDGTGEAIRTSLKDAWTLARFYKKGTVRLLTDIKANIGSESSATSRPLWDESFYQMATGIGTNITFDFNGHTMDADMINLTQKITSLGVKRKFETNFPFLVNQGSTLTLEDSVGGGGIKNVVSGTSYPAAVHVEGVKGNDSYLNFNNVSITGCYSGKGVLYAANEYSHIKISGNPVIESNKKVLSDDAGTSSLGTQDLNLFVEKHTDVSSAGINDDARIGLTASAERHNNTVPLIKGEIAHGFFSDDERYIVITKNNHACLVDKERSNEAFYESPDGIQKTTVFSDAWSYAILKGGKITILKNFTPDEDVFVFDSEQELVIDFNGKTITPEGDGAEYMFDIAGNVSFVDAGQADKTESVVSSAGNASYNSNTGKITYYTSMLEGESNSSDNTTNKKLVITKHTDDISSMGGILASGYSKGIFKGNVDISGGKYSSTSGIAHMSGTISNAYIYNSGNTNKVSGMIYGDANLLIDNCVISCNQADNGTVAGLNISVSNSIISGNKASIGAGVYLDEGEGNTMMIQNSHISYNEAASDGGGIYCAVDSGFDNVAFISKTISIKDSYVNGNKAANGAGIFVQSTDDESIVSNCQIAGNTASTNGGGIYMYDSILHISDNDISLNSAAVNGGGIYYSGNPSTDISNAYLSNDEIDGNKAGKGGGVFVGIIRMYLQDDIVMRGNDNTGLFIVKNMQVRAYDLTSGYIPFRTADIPQRQYDVPVAETGTDEKAHHLVDEGIMIPDFYVMKIYNNALWLEIDKNAEFNGVMVQYYSYTTNISHTSDRGSGYAGKDLFVIDTSCDSTGTPLEKAELPKNFQTVDDVGSKYIYLNVDTDNSKLAHVDVTKVLKPIFNDRDVNQNEVYEIGDVDLFTLENLSYEPIEIWVLKGDDYTSTDKKDFDVYPYDSEMKFNFNPGSVIRIVCDERVDESYLNEVVFYDYDITDGYWYNTIDDAKNQTNGNDMETLLYDFSSKSLYVNTKKQGINSPENYKESDKIHYAFGNNNAGSGYAGEQWNDGVGNVITLNQANRLSKNIKLCTFGLAKGLDNDGNIIWADNVTVPNLFNEGDALGKTTYVGNHLVFKRRGDTYTFTGVDEFGITGLDSFINTAGSIWSNNFWPMDNVSSWGSSTHDPKIGGKELRPTWNRGLMYVGDDWEANKYVSKTTLLPQSDDSIVHNPYYGMYFSMSFKLPEDYVGPLEYWFFGDDEMFIFLDNKLICDIGGVHTSVGQYMNLWNYIDEGDTSEHTLSFFYTERGASGSTCWMQFTAPNVYPSTKVPRYLMYRFKKVDEKGNAITGAEFSLYNGTTNLLTVKSDEEGYVTFNNLEQNIKYTVKETKTASIDYMLDETKYILEYINGSWTMYEEGDESKRPVAQVVNISKEWSESLPDAGGSGTNGIYYISILCLIIGLLLIVYLKMKKHNM